MKDRLFVHLFKTLVNDRYFLLPALSAFLLALARYPFKLNFVVFFAFVPLMILFAKHEEISLKRLLKTALVFSTVYTAVALYWISVVTFPGFLGMFILFGLYFFVLFMLVLLIARRLPKFKYWGLISCWLSFEWLQNFGEFRFPWFNIGYSLSDYTPLIQIAEIGGIYLLSFMILIVNLLLFYSFYRFPQRISKICFALFIVIMLFWIVWGSHRLNSIPLQETDLDIAIVQVSIPQDLKWSEAFFDSTLALYEKYTLKAAEREPDLIIWPESAVPDYVLRSVRSRMFISKTARKANTDIFTGFPHYEYRSDNPDQEILYYNTATLFRKGGTVEEPYQKIILVPFGERIPFMNILPFLKKLDFGQANWEYGENIQYYYLHNDNENYKFSPLICFEIAFPKLTNQMALDQTDFMVNITNDAWFKRTIGPYQHAAMTAIRAVETRTQIYRAANTGFSIIVNPKGVITQKTKLYEQTFITDKLYTYPKQTIFVTRLRYFPLIFLLLAIVLIIMALMTYLVFNTGKNNINKSRQVL
jgi:apolipoprotein N-acyltransferase